jgi:hypothetical protein
MKPRQAIFNVPTVECGGPSRTRRSTLFETLRGVLDRAEALDGNDRLYLMLEAAGLPVEACALADIEIGNFSLPFCVCVFARN